MPFLTILILAIVQGITEFLPISSSGHLVLAEHFMGKDRAQIWAAHEGLNIAVHLGTLFSVLLYYRKDVVKMFAGLRDLGRRDASSEGAKLNIHILIGSIPVIIAGYILNLLEPSWLVAMEVIAWTTLIFGFLLWVVDARAKATKELKEMSALDALIIGLAQSIALIPGTSRSGITMTAARALGYSRTESAHFSLLLAIIAITGAATIGMIELYQSGTLAMGLDLLMATILAFIAGYISIVLMMKWLAKCSFAIFGIYRILLGMLLLFLIYGVA